MGAREAGLFLQINSCHQSVLISVCVSKIARGGQLRPKMGILVCCLDHVFPN